MKQYGDRLLCVRYRYDRVRRKRYKTAKVITDEAPWEPPPPAPETIVYVRVTWGEAGLSRQIKLAGGQWQRGVKLWALQYSEVERLGLQDRLSEPPVLEVVRRFPLSTSRKKLRIHETGFV